MRIVYGGELTWFEDEEEFDEDTSDEQINHRVRELVRYRVDHWFRHEPESEA